MFDDDDSGISDVALLYGGLIIIGVVCIILGGGALWIYWLRSVFYAKPREALSAAGLAAQRAASLAGRPSPASD